MVFFKPLFSGCNRLRQSRISPQIVADFIQRDARAVSAVRRSVDAGMTRFVIATFFSLQKFDTAVFNEMQVFMQFLAIFLPDMAAADRIAVQKHILRKILFSPAGAAAMPNHTAFFISLIGGVQRREFTKCFACQIYGVAFSLFF